MSGAGAEPPGSWETLGEITVPSGIVVLVDFGCLWAWSYDGGPIDSGFMTSWGDGMFPVERHLDAAGRLVRLRIDLGNDVTIGNLEAAAARAREGR